MSKPLWQNFSKEQLEQFVNESTTLMEVVIKIGYKADHHRYQQIRDMAAFHNISIEHLKMKPQKVPENLTGQRFGKLKVLDFGEKTATGKITFLCQCDCGKKVIVQAGNLKDGHTKSCGCIKKGQLKAEDLVGQVFGKLTVIERDTSKNIGGGQAPYWLCKCSCGNPDIISVRGYNLTHNITHSCGCLYQDTQSWGEKEIEKILTSKSISFVEEYSFRDLIGKQKPLRFDFAIFNEKNTLLGLIEYQGEQHFKQIDYFGEKSFQITQENDKKKKEYCSINNIPLFYINYNENILEKMENILFKINK